MNFNITYQPKPCQKIPLSDLSEIDFVISNYDRGREGGGGGAQTKSKHPNFLRGHQSFIVFLFDGFPYGELMLVPKCTACIKWNQYGNRGLKTEQVLDTQKIKLINYYPMHSINKTTFIAFALSVRWSGNKFCTP